MAKFLKRIDNMPRKPRKNDNEKQLSLLDYFKTRHQDDDISFDLPAKFKNSLSEAIKKSPLSALRIADEMSRLSGRNITESMIRSWTAPNKSHQIPVVLLGLFCKITGSSYPLRVISHTAELYIMESPDALRSEKAKNQEMIRDLQAENRQIDAINRKLEGSG